MDKQLAQTSYIGHLSASTNNSKRGKGRGRPIKCKNPTPQNHEDNVCNSSITIHEQAVSAECKPQQPDELLMPPPPSTPAKPEKSPEVTASAATPSTSKMEDEDEGKSLCQVSASGDGHDGEVHETDEGLADQSEGGSELLIDGFAIKAYVSETEITVALKKHGNVYENIRLQNLDEFGNPINIKSPRISGGRGKSSPVAKPPKVAKPAKPAKRGKSPLVATPPKSPAPLTPSPLVGSSDKKPVKRKPGRPPRSSLANSPFPASFSTSPDISKIKSEATAPSTATSPPSADKKDVVDKPVFSLSSPVFVPVSAPLAAPVSAPLAAPVSAPLAAPVSAPLAATVSTAVNPMSGLAAPVMFTTATSMPFGPVNTPVARGVTRPGRGRRKKTEDRGKRGPHGKLNKPPPFQLKPMDGSRMPPLPPLLPATEKPQYPSTSSRSTQQFSPISPPAFPKTTFDIEALAAKIQFPPPLPTTSTASTLTASVSTATAQSLVSSTPSATQSASQNPVPASPLLQHKVVDLPSDRPPSGKPPSERVSSDRASTGSTSRRNTPSVSTSSLPPSSLPPFNHSFNTSLNNSGNRDHSRTTSRSSDRNASGSAHQTNSEPVHPSFPSYPTYPPHMLGNPAVAAMLGFPGGVGGFPPLPPGFRPEMMAQLLASQGAPTSNATQPFNPFMFMNHGAPNFNLLQTGANGMLAEGNPALEQFQQYVQRMQAQVAGHPPSTSNPPVTSGHSPFHTVNQTQPGQSENKMTSPVNSYHTSLTTAQVASTSHVLKKKMKWNDAHVKLAYFLYKRQQEEMAHGKDKMGNSSLNPSAHSSLLQTTAPHPQAVHRPKGVPATSALDSFERLNDASQFTENSTKPHTVSAKASNTPVSKIQNPLNVNTSNAEFDVLNHTPDLTPTVCSKSSGGVDAKSRLVNTAPQASTSSVRSNGSIENLTPSQWTKFNQFPKSSPPWPKKELSDLSRLSHGSSGSPSTRSPSNKSISSLKRSHSPNSPAGPSHKRTPKPSTSASFAHNNINGANNFHPALMNPLLSAAVAAHQQSVSSTDLNPSANQAALIQNMLSNGLSENFARGALNGAARMPQPGLPAAFWNPQMQAATAEKLNEFQTKAAMIGLTDSSFILNHMESQRQARQVAAALSQFSMPPGFPPMIPNTSTALPGGVGSAGNSTNGASSSTDNLSR